MYLCAIDDARDAPVFWFFLEYGELIVFSLEISKNDVFSAAVGQHGPRHWHCHTLVVIHSWKVRFCFRGVIALTTLPLRGGWHFDVTHATLIDITV